jgi:Carboxylesterase family
MANDAATTEAGVAPVVEIAAGKVHGISSAGIFSVKAFPMGPLPTDAVDSGRPSRRSPGPEYERRSPMPAAHGTYSLDWQSPAHNGRLKAHHAMDLPFVFDNVDVADTTAGAPGARELAARISETWIAFARNGSPDNPVIPSWPAYSTEDRATMSLDTDCRVMRDPGREMRLLWGRVVAHQS